MIENRHPVSASFNPILTVGAEARWVGRDLSAKQVEARGERVLIVEDEALLRVCLRRMLELEGHQVTEASNGAEALYLFQMGKFHLVVTDFEMPVMPGDQLAVAIKRLAPRLPILMVTGSGRARRDASNPVDALLTKPFTAADLRCALGKLLSARPEPAPPSEVVRTLENPASTFALEDSWLPACRRDNPVLQ